jgi:hypothetical protein
MVKKGDYSLPLKMNAKSKTTQMVKVIRKASKEMACK